ncbi:MAG TPA: hypothetical protein VLJ86_21790, partial [Ramlibacter sp.]|nr:hypothetical protein [Ramlibacter sp.]
YLGQDPVTLPSWTLRYKDVSTTANANGVEAYISHAAGGSAEITMDSDTNVSMSANMGSSGASANMTFETGGTLTIQSASTQGGYLHGTSRNGDVVFTSIDTSVARSSTGGNVELTSELGNISFEAPPIVSFSLVDNFSAGSSGLYAPGATVTLAAREGSLGAADNPLPLGGMARLDLFAKNAIGVSLDAAPPATLNIETTAGGTGAIDLYQPDPIISGLLVAGPITITRDTSVAGGEKLVLGGFTEASGVTSFGLTVTDGGISVGGDVTGLQRLDLHAQGGDLTISAVGAGAARTVSANTMNLSAGQDILIQAGTQATESVAVTAADALAVNSDLQMSAGRDIRITADGASALVSFTSGSPSNNTQTLSAGRDFRIEGGSASGAFAKLDTLGGYSYQNLSAGGDMVVQGGSGAGAYAALNVSRSMYQQSIYVVGNLLVAGGAGAGASAQMDSLTTYQSLNISGNVDIAAGQGADSFARLSAGASSNQSGRIGGHLHVLAGNAPTGQGAGAYAAMSAGTQNLPIGGSIEVVGGSALGTTARISSTGNQALGQPYNYNGTDSTDSIRVAGGSGEGATASIQAGSSQSLYASRTVDGAGLVLSSGDITVEGGSGLNASASISSTTGGQTVGSTYTHYNYPYYQYRPTHDIQVIGGTGDGASASITSGAGQTVAGLGRISVKAGDGLGASAQLSAGGTQYVGRSGDSYYQAADAVEVLAGAGASASITSTGNQRILSGGNISVIGGDVAGMTASIVSTGGSQALQSSSRYVADSGNAPASQDVLIKGGTATGATALVSAATAQTVIGQRVLVLGGSGAGASAVLENGTLPSNSSQTIGSMSTYEFDPTSLIKIEAGSGGVARVTAAGSQTLRSDGDIIVKGGTGAGMTATLESLNGSQSIGTSYRQTYYYGNATQNIYVQGGTGVGATATVSAATGQTLEAGGTIAATAGAAGANALVSNTAGTQRIGYAQYEDGGYYYDNTDLVVLTGAAGASARATSGQAQQVQSQSGVRLASGTGAGSTAQLAAGTSQHVQTFGNLAVQGGVDSGTGLDATGLLLAATGGSQTIYAQTGITLTGGAGATDVTISNLGAGTQTVSTDGQLALLAPSASSGAVSIDAAVGAQSLQAGSILLANSGASAVRVRSEAAAQSITAGSMRIDMSGTRAGSFTGLQSGAGQDQSIRLTGDDVTAGTATLTILNTNSSAGSTAGIQSGGKLDLLVTDDNYDTAGAVQIGSVDGLGRAEITAATDLTMVAGSLLIQGGASAAASAALNATDTMNISTVYGKTELIAGTAGSASIDPLFLNVVSSNSVLLAAGDQSTADSTINAGIFNLAATSGDLTMLNPFAGVATISADTFNYVGDGNVFLTAGSIGVTTAGAIDIAGLCVNCDTNLFGPFIVKSFVPPVVPPPITLPFDPFVIGGELIRINNGDHISLAGLIPGAFQQLFLEDGTVITVRTRGTQCY